MNKISEYELHVARFYMKRMAYVAALNRAKYVIENYNQIRPSRRSSRNYG